MFIYRSISLQFRATSKWYSYSEAGVSKVTFFQDLLIHFSFSLILIQSYPKTKERKKEKLFHGFLAI